NNHPIRTATAMGYAALAFEDHEDSPEILDWAMSELDYLWGPTGRYVQSDGGVSEGPFYYSFGFSPTMAFFIAVHNRADPERLYNRDCVNRSSQDPWAGHGCVPGESFAFENPLHSDYFRASVDWAISLRTATGQRPPLADGGYSTQVGPVLFTSFGGPGYYYWDWVNNTKRPMRFEGWMNMKAYHLAYVDDSVEATEPPWRNRFLPASGNAIFRSGWGSDDRWLLLMGENGAARKTVHDHVDGTSLMMSAYGENLLIDTGYYKPNNTNNAITSSAGSHSVILIDGVGAPDKGILTDWGDTDSFIENTMDGDAIAWAESRQSYEQSDIVRGVAFVRQRYFVVADRVTTTATEAREHRLRFHANAGYDQGYTAELMPYGVHIARERGGAELHIAATAGELTHIEPSYREGRPPHIHSLGNLNGGEGHHFVSDSRTEALAPDFLTVIAPYRLDAPDSDPDAKLVVTALEAGENAWAWLIETSEGSDLAWVREDAAASVLTLPGGQVVETDAHTVIVALDGSFGLMARGTRVSLDGAPVLEASEGQPVVSVP
ncbi:MAG: heparinase II/III family protein, partial [Myxococcota bacterium]|nr:heparinase II/III family protein [Myxococcota bacterium]